MKLRPVPDGDQIRGYYFDCPGCGSGHYLTVNPYVANNGASWTFNGDLDAPTFRPSVLQRIDFTETLRQPKICHSFITDGRIEFLSDCTHALAGQTVDLPEVDDEEI